MSGVQESSGASASFGQNANVVEGGAREVVKQGGGETNVSFDEVERIYDTEKAEKANQKRATRKAKEIDFDPESESSDSKGAKEASKKDGDTLKEATKDAVADGKDAGKASEVKKFKVQIGDSVVEVSDNATFPVKVAGKVEQATLKDLMTDFSGRKDWAPKYAQLDSEKKSFYSERDQIVERINKIGELSEKDPGQAINYLVEVMGGNPVEFQKRIASSIREPIKKHFESGGTVEDLLASFEVNDQKLELEFYRQKNASEVERKQRESEKDALNQRVSQICEQHKIKTEEYEQAQSDLNEYLRTQGKEAKDVKPEQIIEWHLIGVRSKGIDEVISENFAEDPRAMEIADELFSVWKQNPEATVSDIKDIAKEAFGKKDSMLARKLQKTGEIRKQTQAASPQNEFMTWDDF